MPLQIAFTLSDADLDRFGASVKRARAAMDPATNAEKITSAAMELVWRTMNSELPDFIRERMGTLEVLISMLQDTEWQLVEADRRRILDVLVYCCDPDDLISDDTPGLGFLDDAIFVELAALELEVEISAYAEFCEYRRAEEQRRHKEGKDDAVSREEWLANKRKMLHSRIRQHRAPGSDDRARRIW